MSIYSYSIIILETFFSIYILTAFFKWTTKYKKYITFIVIVIYTIFWELFSLINLNDNLYLVLLALTDLLLFYFFFSGNCINNLIKINLINILYFVVCSATTLITTFLHYIIIGPYTNVFGSNSADGFEFITYSLSAIIYLSLIRIIDNQFGNWVFNLSGLTQSLVLIISTFIPFIYLPISFTLISMFSPEHRDMAHVVSAGFLFSLLLLVLIIALRQRKKEIIEIKNIIDHENEQYQKLMNLNLHMRILRHDLSNFLESSSPPIQDKIIAYCNEIKKDLEEIK